MTKVLVVEDNERNRYLISFLLKGDGFEVIEAFTGEDGVEMAIREQPDVVLMDIQLPGIDGYANNPAHPGFSRGREGPHHCADLLCHDR